MDVVEPVWRPPAADADAEDRPGSMWHVTLTVAGDAVATTEIRAALERLSEEHPFLLSGRYATDRAEVRYWEEAPDAATAVGMTVRLWDEHVGTAGLPPWQVVGVEVVDRETFHRRGQRAQDSPGLVATGRVIPF